MDFRGNAFGVGDNSLARRTCWPLEGCEPAGYCLAGLPCLVPTFHLHPLDFQGALDVLALDREISRQLEGMGIRVPPDDEDRYNQCPHWAQVEITVDRGPSGAAPEVPYRVTVRVISWIDIAGPGRSGPGNACVLRWDMGAVGSAARADLVTRVRADVMGIVDCLVEDWLDANPGAGAGAEEGDL